MHVLIIPSWYPTDASDINGSFFREQALALRRHGCQVGVICPQLRSLRNWRAVLNGKRGIAYENDEALDTYRSFGTNWFPRTGAIRRLWIHHGLKLFRTYVRAHGAPDLVHVHSMLYAGLVACEIERRHGIPFVLTEHSSAFARNLVNPSQLLLARRIAGAAAVRLAVSREFSSLLDQILIDTNSQWDVLPNIVNQEFISYPIKPKLHNRDFRFISIGSMIHGKKQSNIVQAFAEGFKGIKNVGLTIGGDGPEMRALKRLASDLGVGGRINFPGKLSRQQVMVEIAASDAFVLSSLYETFGVVLIEALALGKPVIATRCGGPESIVRNEDGLLVPVDDVPSLAAAMRYVHDNKGRYDSEKIRAACSARYGERAIVAQLLRIYRSTVGYQCA